MHSLGGVVLNLVAPVVKVLMIMVFVLCLWFGEVWRLVVVLGVLASYSHFVVYKRLLGECSANLLHYHL